VQWADKTGGLERRVKAISFIKRAGIYRDERVDRRALLVISGDAIEEVCTSCRAVSCPDW
jgi:hypothetical protein